MDKFNDLTGKTFGEWTVIGGKSTANQRSRWTCMCSCGTVREVQQADLLLGKSKSCGCSRGENLKGRKFGRLTVIKKVAELTNNNGRKWLCMCDCGNETVVSAVGLKSGHTKSCGCYQHDVQIERKTTHGKSDTRTFRIWIGMRARCHNPKAGGYKNYGGRGIKVCDRWDDFSNFLTDMGERPPGLTLERVDNDGDYCKENCKWITRKEQAKNRRTNHLLTHNNKTQTIMEWSQETGVKYSTIISRLRAKWPLEMVLSINIFDKYGNIIK